MTKWTTTVFVCAVLTSSLVIKACRRRFFPFESQKENSQSASQSCPWKLIDRGFLLVDKESSSPHWIKVVKLDKMVKLESSRRSLNEKVIDNQSDKKERSNHGELYKVHQTSSFLMLDVHFSTSSHNDHNFALMRFHCINEKWRKNFSNSFSMEFKLSRFSSSPARPPPTHGMCI